MVARILINNRFDQRIDNPLRRRRPATPRAIQQPQGRSQCLPSFKAPGPVVNRPPANMEVFGDFLGTVALIQEQQSQGALILPRITLAVEQRFQYAPLPLR
jgi:hypothetical protein